MKDKKWASIVDTLRDKLGPYSYWLNEVRCLSLSKDRVRLIAPNPFIRDRVKEKLKGAIQECISQELGGDPEIQILVDSGLFYNKKRHIYNDKGKSLEHFLIEAGNELPYQAAREITIRRSAYNPLVIYGPSGSGKSHLVYAVASKLSHTDFCNDVLYINAQTYINQFTWALKGKRIESFQSRCRNCDTFILEDIDLLSNKTAVQQHLLFTITTLINRGRQVICTSKVHPLKLGLSKALSSQLCSGLALSIEPPSRETRLLILQRLSQNHPYPVHKDALIRLDNDFKGSMAELENIFLGILAFSRRSHRWVTPGLIAEVMKYMKEKSSPKFTMSEIAQAVSSYFNLESPKILCDSKKTKISILPRHLAMVLSRKLTQNSLKEIGDFFGGRKDSTVRQACRKFETNKEGQVCYNEVLKKLNSCSAEKVN